MLAGDRLHPGRPGRTNEQHQCRRNLFQQLLRAGRPAGRQNQRRPHLAFRSRANADRRRAIRRASGNFVGANINTVTRSGTNRLQGSIAYSRRDQSLVGTKAGGLPFDPGVFKYKNLGGWLSGPIIPNRLFFFTSIEDESLTQPGTTFTANTGTQTVGGNVTRVRASSLDSLATYLKTNFNYDTGPYTGYNNQTPAHRFLGKLDLNINDQNKFVLRYNRLISSADILESNSNSSEFSATGEATPTR